MRLVFITLAMFSFSLSGLVYATNQSWHVTSETDPFNDRKSTNAYVLTNKGEILSYIRCNNNGKLDVIFEFNHYLASRSPITVSYRIDNNTAKMNREWSVSTDGTAIFADNLDQFRLAKKMMSGQNLYLKTKDFRGTPYSMRISLKGSSSAIQKVLNTCEMSDDYFKKLGIE